MNSKTVKFIPIIAVLLVTIVLPNSKSIIALEHRSSHALISPSPIALTEDVFPDEVWDYWTYGDLKGLDSWGDSGSRAIDIVAVYEKEEPDSLQFRLDFLDLPTEMITSTHFALNFTSGGSTLIEPGNVTVTFDIEWDLMVSITGTKFTLYDSTFEQHQELLVDEQIDRQLDFIAFAISSDAFTGWDGSAFEMQALATDEGHTILLDILDPVTTDDTIGKAKLVLPFGNIGNYQAPYEINTYDGYHFRSNDRPGERRGLRYLLDAAESYKIPITISESRIESFPGLEYLRINDRIRKLAGQGLLDLLAGLGYGHFMAWQPDDIDARAIEIASGLKQDLDLPPSRVFSPYEARITVGDIQVIQDAGFDAIFGLDQYRYWFGWIEDWSDQEIVREDIESLRKIQKINCMTFFFQPSIENYQGFLPDERWEDIKWDENSQYDLYAGTDQGLHLFWRRVLHDMAIDPDQEQFFTIGTDFALTAWMFPEEVDWNFKWLASHPWIEVTTFNSLLERNWAVIDHGDLGLAPDELLLQYPRDGDCGYHAFFMYHYYGGITDDHCPTVPAGVEIEAYYDYVPYLREGVLIQPPRIMGDDQTPGSIIYETLQNLRAAPDNPLTNLAWLSYLMHISEQTWHDGDSESDGSLILGDRAKLQANFLLQVNKIIYAANWADEAAKGALSDQTQVIEQDLDLDGENEYVLSNDRVLAIFENDGGRLEYAFAYDDEYGPVQLVSPSHQYFFKPESEYGFDYTNGEVAILLGWPHRLDGSFVDMKVGSDYYEYGLYSASYTSTSLSFELESYPQTKTFTLEGDTIHAHYEIGSGEENIQSFSFSLNRSGVFNKDWLETYKEVILPGSHGWQMMIGGLALLNFEDTVFSSRFTFSDSPAREEMQEREDPSTYPGGHYFNFPFSEINSYGAGNEEISLTLRASPIRFVFVPVVVR